MKYSFFIRISALTLLSLSTSILGSPATSAPNKKSIQNGFNCVYAIKTAIDATAPKTSYGSGFVIDQSGLLATNFHVVIDAMQKPKSYKVFVVDGKEALEAQVVHFSTTDDVAVLKVSRAFPCKLKLATEKPNVGDRTFSIGIPDDLNKSIVEGVYNGEEQFGPYSSIQMSSAINPGMSGGPTLNYQGDVIGLNVSILKNAQNVAFAVPVSRLKALIEKPPSLYPTQKDKDTLNPEILNQLTNIQNHITKDVLEVGLSSHRVGNWHLMNLPNYLKCWRQVGEHRKAEVISENCTLNQNAQIGGDEWSGQIKTNYLVMDNKKKSPPQFYALINDFSNVSSDASTKDGPGEIETNPLAAGDCQKSRLTNKNGLLIQIKYCVGAYRDLEGLYNFSMVGSVLKERPQALIFRLEASGFNFDNIKRIMSTHLDAIKLER